MAKRQLTLMRFPVAKLNLRVTDPEGNALSGATFAITNGSDTVAKLTSDSKENAPFLSNCMREITSGILLLS